MKKYLGLPEQRKNEDNTNIHTHTHKMILKEPINLQRKGNKKL